MLFKVEFIIKLTPLENVKVGGYGREDVVIYKGAPVGFSAIEKRIKSEGIEAKLKNDSGILVIETNKDPEKIVKIIEEILISAEKDLTDFEEVVKDAIRSYKEKYG